MDQIVEVFNMPVVRALLLLILAFVVATIVRALVEKLLKRTRLNEALDKVDETAEAERGSGFEYLSSLVYLITFLLFVPGIFATLGVGAVADPILNMLNTIWGYLPNVLATAIILTVGLIVAKLVRDLLIPLFEKIGVDNIQKSAGVEVSEDAKLSTTLGYVVYALIVIPVVIVALQTLGISAISDPAISMLNNVLAFLPNIFVAVIIVVVGGIIARIAGGLVEKLLATSGIDARAAGATEGRIANFSVSKTTAGAVRVVIDILFVVEALNVVKLDVLTNIGNSVIAYMPSVLAAIIIAVVAMIASNAAGKALKDRGLGGYAPIAQAAIIIAAAFMALSQLRVASVIVNTAFIAIIAAVAVACAIAFGIGGRDFAAKTLARWSDDIDDAKETLGENKADAPVATEAEAKAEEVADAE